LEGKVEVVSYEGECTEDDKEDEEWKEFAMRRISPMLERGNWERMAYLKAERGGGGGFGTDERPQAMIAIAIVWQLLCLDLLPQKNELWNLTRWDRAGYITRVRIDKFQAFSSADLHRGAVPCEVRLHVTEATSISAVGTPQVSGNLQGQLDPIPKQHRPILHVMNICTTTLVSLNGI
jgi:hypothetical protein